MNVFLLCEALPSRASIRFEESLSHPGILVCPFRFVSLLHDSQIRKISRNASEGLGNLLYL